MPPNLLCRKFKVQLRFKEDKCLNLWIRVLGKSSFKGTAGFGWRVCAEQPSLRVDPAPRAGERAWKARTNRRRVQIYCIQAGDPYPAQSLQSVCPGMPPPTAILPWNNGEFFGKRVAKSTRRLSIIPPPLRVLWIRRVFNASKGRRSTAGPEGRRRSV